MSDRLEALLAQRLAAIGEAGSAKDYRVFASGPGARITTAEGRRLLLFTSNDYLGLAGDPRLAAAASAAAQAYGTGTASARFVCGTTALHRALEREIAWLCATESALTFTSGWTANLALLATLPAPGDLIVSDGLNHASLIDGGRLAARGVERRICPHGDLAALEEILRGWSGPGTVFVASDGVFSMEGTLARLDALVALTRRYDAVLIVDDAHGHGVVGQTGRGTAETLGVLGQIDIVTGSLGKALGGISGGFVAGPAALVRLLEQSARGFLFTTALTPMAAAASLEALTILRQEPGIVQELQRAVAYFTRGLAAAGLAVRPTESAIVPLMLRDADRTRRFAAALERNGVFASSFVFPVVPQGEARIRFQVSRAHQPADLDACIAACSMAARDAA